MPQTIVTILTGLPGPGHQRNKVEASIALGLLRPCLVLFKPMQRAIRMLAWSHAATRTALATLFLVSPDGAGRAWLGPGVTRGGGRVAFRAFAVRDLVLGVGQLHALRTGAPARRWFQLGVAIEAVELASTLRNADDIDGTGTELVNLVGLVGLVGGAVIGDPERPRAAPHP